MSGPRDSDLTRAALPKRADRGRRRSSPSPELLKGRKIDLPNAERGAEEEEEEEDAFLLLFGHFTFYGTAAAAKNCVAPASCRGRHSARPSQRRLGGRYPRNSPK